MSATQQIRDLVEEFHEFVEKFNEIDKILDTKIEQLEKFEEENEDLKARVRELEEEALPFNAAVVAIQEILDSELDSRLRERFEKLLELLKRGNHQMFQEPWQIMAQL